MFHLSIPVDRLEPCLAFYTACFGARVVELAPGVANVFLFGGQLTLHDRPGSALTEAVRSEMHFGAVVSLDEWTELRAHLTEMGIPLLRDIEASEETNGRAKLVVEDPAGNRVEINGE